MTRIKGLDTIRFTAAIFVLFAHIGMPLPSLINNHPQAHLIKQFLSCLFNGPAAVIVFFIISGFCIHHPNQQKDNIDVASFYTRRLIRIGIPAITMVLIYHLLNIELKAPHYQTLWSVICELVYYLLYPVIFYINKKLEWKYLVGFAYLCAITLLLINTEKVLAGMQSYVAMGLSTWIIGLPCWLLGCWLSENYQKFKLLESSKIWACRFLIIFLLIILRIVKSHVTSVFGSNCYTLNAFAMIACIWIAYELKYFSENPPNRLLESAAKWSYSLYLIHPAVRHILYQIKIYSPHYQHLLIMLMCFLLAYVFYLLIEFPAHKLATVLSIKLKSTTLKRT